VAMQLVAMRMGFMVLYWLAASGAKSKKSPSPPPNPCRGGEGCIFMSKDLGWQVFNESGAERRQHPILPTFDRETVSIYMTMSSYRDKLCPGTLFNLFSKAANPHRISVGVVQQNAPGDVDCLNRYCEMMKEQNKTDGPGCPFEQQVKMMRLGAEQARGPTWARALGSTLMGQEEFCLQTDSHMDFVPDWDVKMIDMWALTGNEYAVLSTYVADSSSLKDNMPDRKGTNNAFEVPHLCMITLSGMSRSQPLCLSLSLPL
jgi:hypothetical protein